MSDYESDLSLLDDFDSDHIRCDDEYKPDSYWGEIPISNLKLTSMNELKYEFKDGTCVEDLKKYDKSNSYWHQYFSDNGFYEHDSHSIEEILESRLGDLFNRLERVELDRILTCSRPSKFNGCYIPTYGDILKLKTMNIHIDWDVPQCQSQFEVGLEGQKLDSGYIRTFFTPEEERKLFRRWKCFQKEYDFYDIRPFLNIGCISMKKNFYGEFEFFIVKYCSISHCVRFLQYLGKDLPNRSLCSVRQKLAYMIPCLVNNKLLDKVSNKNNVHNGLDQRLAFAIIEKYGFSKHLFRAVYDDGRAQYAILFVHTVLPYVHIPLKCGPWCKQEELELINTIIKVTQLKEGETLFSCSRYNWIKIFDILKCRLPCNLRLYWKSLKPKILRAQSKKLGLFTIEKFQWSNELLCKMIKLVYNSDAGSMNEINWHEIARKMPIFTSLEISGKFGRLLKDRVPLKEQRNFEHAVEYLYLNTRKMLKKKVRRSRKYKADIDHLTQIDIKILGDEWKHLITSYFDNSSSNTADEPEDLIDQS